ncbi:exosome complex RNA-binding protein Csl4 [Thermosphaera chiliense]|uniref:Exosome complex component Csl4 n=1 Tax=Thermosphaera chiliense TaxID=3402707 RepID=A0A7M1UQ75_9CREN|nr:exosome complex RNA-binding protein Csl4 [Thermosphaera aggregans]QOR94418.1 exosome complex RNA-binding protein Csl4 [Thermosphaera aggregans]
MSNAKAVVPGEALGVEEEALPVQGVYVDKKGYLRALVVGTVVMDKLKKTITVRPANKRELGLRPGILVEAIVLSVSDDIAVLNIYNANGAPVDFSGILHVTQVSSEYVKTMWDVLRPGDIVRARVINSTIPYQVSIKDPGLGVIAAKCSVCGEVLYKAGDKLQCTSCGSVETRRIGVGYLYVLR